MDSRKMYVINENKKTNESLNNKEKSTEFEVPTETHKQRFWSKWCRHGFSFWCKKYFWEGQLTTGTQQVFSDDHFPPGMFDKIKLTPTRRKLLAMLLPAVLCHLFWWALMIKHHWWYFFTDKYPMTIIMIFAALIAGSTGKAAGGIIFPVMTLAMDVSPGVARDFAILMQSLGLGCASFSIFFMNIHFEKHALICCLLGGSVGIVIGLELVDGILSPSWKKMCFVSIWFSFTVALFLLNIQRKRKTLKRIPLLNVWKIALLICVGIIGGIISAISGSGLDICCYCTLTLFFRISEKVATPTSIMLMAFSSMVGAFWRGLVLIDISESSWQFFMVSIPVVVFAAPAGSVLGSHFHRLVLAGIIHVIDTIALIGAFAIVPQTPALAGGAVAIIVLGSLTFFLVSKVGEKMLNYYLKTYNNKSHNKSNEEHCNKAVMAEYHTSNEGHVNKVVMAEFNSSNE